MTNQNIVQKIDDRKDEFRVKLESRIRLVISDLERKGLITKVPNSKVSHSLELGDKDKDTRVVSVRLGGEGLLIGLLIWK